MKIIKDLDNVEKRIMKYTKNDERKNLRPLVHGLYKKLQFCAPIRTKKQYESSEYQDPKPNNNREDLDKCPREEFTETNLSLRTTETESLPVSQSTQLQAKIYNVYISIVYIDISEAKKLKQLIIDRYSKNMRIDLNIGFEMIDILKVNIMSFHLSDYIIFNFPKSVIKCSRNQPKIEKMIGWAIKMNDTGKCVVLNKPKFKFFDRFIFNFEHPNESTLDMFIEFLVSLSQKDSKIIPRDDTLEKYHSRRAIPWLIWIHDNFQKVFTENKHDFDNFGVHEIYCPPESKYWTLIYIILTRGKVQDSYHSLTIENTFPALKFGSIHQSNKIKIKKGTQKIKEIKSYDTDMLHRVHKLRKKLKYEQKKYNKFKKRNY